MEIPKRKYLLGMYARYYDDITKYPKYENYDAINVNKVVDIPFDYEGVMGVPITFLDKYNPDQFEILLQVAGNTRANYTEEELSSVGYSKHPEDRGGCGIIHGKRVYSRILIKHKLKYNEHGIVQKEN